MRRARKKAERAKEVFYDLLTLAGEQDEDGVISGFDEDDLAEWSMVTTDDLRAALDALRSVGWVRSEPDGSIFLPHFAERNPSPDPTAAARKRRQRQRERDAEKKEADEDKATCHDMSRVTDRDSRGVTSCHDRGDQIRSDQIRPEESTPVDSAAEVDGQALTLVEPPSKEPKADHVGDMIAAYRETCVPAGMPDVRRVTKRLRGKIATRMREEPDLAYWRRVFAKAAASPLCRGEASSSTWCDLRWITESEENHTKIAEGRYDKRQAAARAAGERSYRDLSTPRTEAS